MPYTRVLCILFIVCTGALLLIEGYASYKVELRKAADNADSLSLLLEERLTADMRIVDTLLENLSDTIPPTFDPHSPSSYVIGNEYATYIHRQLSLTPVVDNLSLLSPDGTTFYTQTGAVGEKMNNAPFFKELRSKPDTTSLFSNIYESPATRLPVISLAHSFKSQHEEFGGVIAADFDMFYFQRLLQNIDVGKYGFLALQHNDGQLVASMPETLGKPGSTFALPVAIGPRIEREFGWTARGQLAFETSPRMFSVRALPGLPFHVVVGLSDKDFLSAWRAKIGIHTVFILVLIILTILLDLALGRERKRIAVLKQTQMQVEQSRMQLHAVIEAAPIALAISDLDDGHLILSNHAMREIVGRQGEQPTLKHLRQLCANAADLEKLTSGLTQHGFIEHLEVQILCSDGTTRWLLIHAKIIDFDEGRAVIIGGGDITERKALETKLTEQATIDSLTGLVNRRSFDEHTVIEYQRARRNQRALSALMIDIDRFKQINDTYGHAIGDRIIQQFASSLRHLLRATDIAARLGGDEFAIILPDTNLQNAMLVAQRICNSAAQASLLLSDGQVLKISISVGAAALSVEDEGFDPIMHRADGALYSAKNNGRNQVAAKAYGE